MSANCQARGEFFNGDGTCRWESCAGGCMSWLERSVRAKVKMLPGESIRKYEYGDYVFEFSVRHRDGQEEPVAKVVDGVLAIYQR